MALCPIQRTVQILARFWSVQPEFVFGNDQGRTDEPYARLLLFDKNLPSSELFAKRNLSI